MNRTFGVYLPEALFQALELAREENTRSRSNAINHYVRQGLRRDGYLTSRTADAPKNEQ